MRRRAIACGLAALALLVAGCGEEEESGLQGGGDTAAEEQAAEPEATAEAPPAPAAEKPRVDVPKGPPPKKLQVTDLKKGSGATAEQGSQVSVNYVGVSYKTGKEFDNSYDRGMPFDLQLGAGMVIPGWDEGLEGMKVGGRRRLVIPPDKAYGAQGQPPTIGPNETLVFVIDLVDVQPVR